MTSRSRLRAAEIRVHYAGVKAIDGVDLEFEQGEIVALIGPNGSGKTTCLNALTGFARLSGGSVMLDSRDISHWSPARRSRAHIGRTFQGVRLFADLTVRENVEVAALASGLSRRKSLDESRRLLSAMSLTHLSRVRASSLSAGDERRVGIARAVATQPKFLLLDEPAAGLDDEESLALVDTIRLLRDTYSCGVLLVDHDMRVITAACTRLHVLDAGRTIAEGDPDAVGQDPAVAAAYFGEAEADN